MKFFHFLCVIALACAGLVTADECGDAHTTQKSCDADKTTGGGCVWCKCGALPSACWTIANSEKLPPGVYICDKPASENTFLRKVIEALELEK